MKQHEFIFIIQKYKSLITMDVSHGNPELKIKLTDSDITLIHNYKDHDSITIIFPDQSKFLINDKIELENILIDLGSNTKTVQDLYNQYKN